MLTLDSSSTTCGADGAGGPAPAPPRPTVGTATLIRWRSLTLVMFTSGGFESSSGMNSAFLDGVAGGDEPADEGGDEDDGHQVERGAPGEVDRGLVGRRSVVVDQRRQGGVPAVEQTPVWPDGGADDQHDRGRLAGGAGDRQQGAAHDAGDGGRDHHGQRGAPLAGAQRQAGLA